MRKATNKAWVLGKVKFKREVEVVAKRRADFQDRVGDRRSVRY